jgi:hypothetical protein
MKAKSKDLFRIVTVMENLTKLTLEVKEVMTILPHYIAEELHAIGYCCLARFTRATTFIITINK